MLLAYLSQRYPSHMATVIEIEKLALDLSEEERATLAASLLESLPGILADEDEGFAEASRRDAEIEADPNQAITLAQLDSQGLLGGQYSMSSTLIDEAKLKEALKSAIVEILEERKDLVRDLLEEALEDIALARAIEEGEQSQLVTRDEVFDALERN